MELCSELEDIQATQELTELEKIVSLLRLRPHIDAVSTLSHSEDQTDETSFAAEARILKQFSVKYKSQRMFNSHFHSSLFTDILTSLINNRLADEVWLKAAPVENLLRVVVCVRILIRDTSLQKHFIHQDGVATVTQHLQSMTQLYTSDGDAALTLDILRELTNVVQKLSVDVSHVTSLTRHGVERCLVILLSVSDISLLHCVLQALINFTREPQTRRMVADLSCVVEMLLVILQDYDITSKQLGAQLMRSILAEQAAREMIKVCDGIPLLLSLLHGDGVRLLWNVVWCLVMLSSDSDASNEIRSMGGIPLLLSMLHDRRSDTVTTTTYNTADSSSSSGCLMSANDVASSSSSSSSTIEPMEVCCSGELSLKAACCACLTELVVNDANGQQTVQNNGIYLLAWLLVGPITRRHELYHVTADAATVQLQVYSLRALRFLFSVERNRRHFKRMFPADLFEAFIDVGHYNRDISAYLPLVNKLNCLTSDMVDEVRCNVDAANQDKAPSRLIGDYAVCEILGSGAFGTVYKVRKQSGQSFLAMKEVSTLNVSWGKTTKERQNSVGDVINELTIIREQLKHPNIVRYYRTFIVEDKLYIVMELVEGATLAEHFASLKEKRQKFSESRIWNIFVQIVLALRYLHKEKAIIHRDLTPNNVMLDENDKVTVTDFGLAKQKRADCSRMNSVVGTILCSCPEIIQNLPYGEKADVWSLGCLLYQMCTLKPAFYSSNMLTLATKIVNADYEPLRDNDYTPLISSTISRCLTVKEDCRPDVLGVSAHISSVLLGQLDTERRHRCHLEKKLDRERRRTQKHFCETNSTGLHCRQHTRRLMVDDTTTKAAFKMNGDDVNGGDVLSYSSSSACSLQSSYTSEYGGQYWVNSETAGHVPRPPSSLSRPRSSKPRGLGLSSSASAAASPAACHLSLDVLAAARSANRSGWSSSANASPSHSAGATDREPTASPLLVDVRAPASTTPTSTLTATNLPAEHSSGLDTTTTTPARPQSLTALDSASAAAAAAAAFRTSPATDVALQRATKSRSAAGPGVTSSPAMLSISPNKMRQINDPILQLLHQLHRIIVITQLAPSVYYNPRRRAVECFKRALFGRHSSATTLKNELHKLVTGSRDVIDLNFGNVDTTSKMAEQVSSERESVAANVASGECGYELEPFGEVGITYEQMRALIDSLLQQSIADSHDIVTSRCQSSSAGSLHRQHRPTCADTSLPNSPQPSAAAVPLCSQTVD